MGWAGQASLRPAHLWYTTSWMAEPGRPANQFLVQRYDSIHLYFIIIIIILLCQLWGPPKITKCAKSIRFILFLIS